MAVRKAWKDTTGTNPIELTLHLLVQGTTVVLVCSSEVNDDAIASGRDAVLGLDHIEDVQVLSPR